MADARTAAQRLAIFLATGAYLGYAPVAPGTFGTLLGVALFSVLGGLRQANPAAYAAAVAAAAAGAMWVAGRAEIVLREHDSPRIVIDEVAGYLAASTFVPFTWFSAGLAFILFRLFDIVKPFPAGWAERRLRGGLGVVADDLVAGAYAGLLARVLLSYVFV